MKPIDLKKHPEGGRYLRVFKSNVTVSKKDGQIRSALTHIYYSLKRGEVSCFHKVNSDEIWNLYQGTGVYLYLWDGSKKAPKRVVLSAASSSFCYVVPGGTWQAAEPMEEEVLVGCSVGPGFDYADYELIESNTDLVNIIRENHPDFMKYASSTSQSKQPG